MTIARGTDARIRALERSAAHSVDPAVHLALAAARTRVGDGPYPLEVRSVLLDRDLWPRTAARRDGFTIYGEPWFAILPLPEDTLRRLHEECRDLRLALGFNPGAGRGAW